MLVPVYSRYLQIEDLKGLIKFYDSPLGKKYSKYTPFLTQQSMEVGQKWGK